MDYGRLACVSAGLMGSLMVMVTAHPGHSKPRNDVVITGDRFDPVTQRRVSYADLNLAIRPDQKQLRSRIHDAANNLCGPALGYDLRDEMQENCVIGAVASTHWQVYSAIKRAKLQLAGHAVGPAVAISMTVMAR